MVCNRKCEVCEKNRNSSPNLSFHRLPDNDERRRIWSSLMGWSNICPKRKAIFICSDHFDSNDFVTRDGGKRYLKRDANPLPQHRIFENSSIRSFWASGHNPEESEPEEGNSSSTLTASEFEDEESQMKFLEPNADKMHTEERKRKYIGDSSSGDFSTPGKRSRSFKNASIEQETEQDEEIPEIKIEIEEHNVLSEQFQENSTGDSSCADSLVTLVKSEPEDEPMPEEGLLVGQAPAANEAQDMESDACTYFGKYVAAELRNLPWTTRVVVQQEIQSCIAAAIIRNANESNNSDPTNADAAGLPH